MSGNDIRNLIDNLNNLTENKELAESMTEDEAIKEIKKLSEKLMNLANNIGAGDNSKAFDAVTAADEVLTDYLNKQTRRSS